MISRIVPSTLAVIVLLGGYAPQAFADEASVLSKPTRFESQQLDALSFPRFYATPGDIEKQNPLGGSFQNSIRNTSPQTTDEVELDIS
jgi:hypothetical protein